MRVPRLRTVGCMDAAVKLTGMYLQRVLSRGTRITRASVNVVAILTMIMS